MFSFELDSYKKRPESLEQQNKQPDLNEIKVEGLRLSATYKQKNVNEQIIPTEVLFYLAYLASQNPSVKNIQLNFANDAGTPRAPLSLSYSTITEVTAHVNPKEDWESKYWPDIWQLFTKRKKIDNDKASATNSAQLGQMGASFISSATFTAGIALILLTAFPLAVIAAPIIGAIHFAITYGVNQRQARKRADQTKLNLAIDPQTDILKEIQAYEEREKIEQEEHRKQKQKSRVLSFVLLTLGTLGALAGLAAAPFTLGLSALATFGIFAAVGATAMGAAYGLQTFIDKQDEKLVLEREKAKNWRQSYFMLRAIIEMDKALEQVKPASTASQQEKDAFVSKNTAEITRLRSLRTSWIKQQTELKDLEKSLEESGLDVAQRNHIQDQIDDKKKEIYDTEETLRTAIGSLNNVIQKSNSPEAKRKAKDATDTINEHVLPITQFDNGVPTKEYNARANEAQAAIISMHRSGQASAIAQGATTGVVVGAGVFAATALGLFASIILTNAGIAAMGFGVIAALGASTFGIGAIVGCAVLAVGVGIWIGREIYKQKQSENHEAEAKLSSQIRPTSHASTSPSPNATHSLLATHKTPITTIYPVEKSTNKVIKFLTSDMGMCLMFGVATLVSGALFGGLFGIAIAAAITLVAATAVGVYKFINWRKKCKAEEEIRKLKEIEKQDLNEANNKKNIERTEPELAKSPSPASEQSESPRATVTTGTPRNTTPSAKPISTNGAILREEETTTPKPQPASPHMHHSQPTLFHASTEQPQPHTNLTTGSSPNNGVRSNI